MKRYVSKCTLEASLCNNIERASVPKIVKKFKNRGDGIGLIGALSFGLGYVNTI